MKGKGRGKGGAEGRAMTLALVWGIDLFGFALVFGG